MGVDRKTGRLPSRRPRTSFRAMLDEWLEEDREFRWEFEEERFKARLADAFDTAREAMGLTQQALAEYCQTTQSAISRFLTGQDARSPRLETLVKLADAVGKRLEFRLVDREPAQASREKLAEVISFPVTRPTVPILAPPPNVAWEDFGAEATVLASVGW